jgi:DNA replication protein DnaC
MQRVKELIHCEIAEERKNLVIFGEGGSGKSLFLIKLMLELAEEEVHLSNNPKREYKVILYKLRELSGVSNQLE